MSSVLVNLGTYELRSVPLAYKSKENDGFLSICKRT